MSTMTQFYIKTSVYFLDVKFRIFGNRESKADLPYVNRPDQCSSYFSKPERYNSRFSKPDRCSSHFNKMDQCSSHHFKNLIFLSMFCLINLVLMLIFSTEARAEPINLQTYKNQLIFYHDSGQYQKDIQDVINKADAYLEKRIQENEKSAHPKKLAMVLDIDETSLSNYADMKANSFGGDLQLFCKLEDQGRDPAIMPTLVLYRLAQKNHVAVFFITGRHEFERKPTEENLIKVGYQKWQALIMKPNQSQVRSASVFKAPKRAWIESQGYDIVLNMGDQQSDLVGGFADKSFKLPNPYYFIP